MEKLTRTKKYAQLREELENDRETAIDAPDLSQYANKLNQFDDQQFHHVENKPNNIATREKELNVSVVKEDEIETMNEDFMSEVVSEVKDYNRKQGLIQDDDTQANILKELRSSNSVRPFGNVSHISEMANQILKDDPVSLEEKNMEEEIAPLEIPFVQDTDINNTISLEIQKLLQSTNDVLDHSFEDSILNDLQIHKPQEVTTQDSSNEISEHNMFTEFHLNQNEDVNNTNEISDEHEFIKDESYVENHLVIDASKKLPKDDEEEEDYDEPSSGNFLNIILVILILVMIVVLAIILYLILMNKGLI